MIKALCLISLLLSSACPTMVDLPKKEVLEHRISAVMGNQFLEETNFVHELANQEMDVFDVLLIIESVLYNYNEDCKNPMSEEAMQRSKSLLVKAVLEDYPSIIRKFPYKGLREE